MISVFPAVMNTSGVMTDLALAAGFVTSPPPCHYLFWTGTASERMPFLWPQPQQQPGFQRAGSAFHGALGFESFPPITNILRFLFPLCSSAISLPVCLRHLGRG